MERVRALPGVVAAGAVSDFFIHRQPDQRIALEGQPPQRPSDTAPPLTGDIALPGYFEAMRIPLLRGRTLDARDLVPNAPRAAVINEEMARRFWPGQDPIGKRFKGGLNPAAPFPWTTVVGVVADMRRQRLDEPAIPYMFQPGAGAQMDITVRTAGDPESRGAVRAVLRELDPAAPPYGVVTVEERPAAARSDAAPAQGTRRRNRMLSIAITAPKGGGPLADGAGAIQEARRRVRFTCTTPERASSVDSRSSAAA